MKTPIYNQHQRIIIREYPNSSESELMVSKLEALKSLREIFATIVQRLHVVCNFIKYIQVKPKYKHLLHSRFK